MTKLLCKILGHHWQPGWYGSHPYFKVSARGRDGIGRIHADLSYDCDRCGERVLAGHIHITDPVIVKALREEAEEKAIYEVEKLAESFNDDAIQAREQRQQPSTEEEYRCPRCGSRDDELYDCCEGLDDLHYLSLQN